jgi:hypothetical protein
MVAAMAAMILAVVLGVGRVVSDVLFHGCEEVRSQLSASGQCAAPEAPAAGDGAKSGSTPVEPAGSSGQGADDSRPVAGDNALGSSDDM